MNGPRDRTPWAEWLLYAAFVACPLSKVIALGAIGSSVTATILNPWFLLVVGVPVVAAAVSVIRRTRQHRRQGGAAWQEVEHDKSSATR